MLMVFAIGKVGVLPSNFFIQTVYKHGESKTNDKRKKTYLDIGVDGGKLCNNGSGYPEAGFFGSTGRGC